jgi:hypothetical protein
VDRLYSGVAPLQGLRILSVMAELKNLEVLATDIGNAYLEADQERNISKLGPNTKKEKANQ